MHPFDIICQQTVRYVFFAVWRQEKVCQHAACVLSAGWL